MRFIQLVSSPICAMLNEAAGLLALQWIFVSSFACELQAAPTEGADNEMPTSLHGHAWWK